MRARFVAAMKDQVADGVELSDSIGLGYITGRSRRIEQNRPPNMFLEKSMEGLLFYVDPYFEIMEQHENKIRIEMGQTHLRYSERLRTLQVSRNMREAI